MKNSYFLVGVSKKTKKPRKPEKNNRKNQTVKKKPIKPIKILKKSAGSVQFRFYKPKTKKTEPKPKTNRAKTGKQTEPKPRKPSQTGLNRFLS
jgi:hypothetical protein